MSLFAGIEKPISPESPCGPDPDLDQDVQNFIAVAEGQLPASYRDFNKKNFDAKPTLQLLQQYVGKFRDIRFLVIHAKYAILSDDLPLFAETIAALPVLLAAQWEQCYPTGNGDGIALRSAHLQSLDDKPTVVLPLQNTAIIVDKRIGIVSMRTILVADKKLPPRLDEANPDLDAIKDAFMRYEPMQHLIDVSNSLNGVKSSLHQLRQIFQEKAGHDLTPMFDQLPAMVDSICNYIAAILMARSPESLPALTQVVETAQRSAELAPEATVAGAGDIKSVKEASNALEAILVYYAASEPSSPARLLVKQAHQLVGKSFVEAMQILAPALAEETKIKFDGDQSFSLNFSQLAALFGENSSSDAGETGEARTFAAASRNEASSLMRGVEQFYKVTEPSSPIPLLVERARNFVARDFASLLKEMAKQNENN